MSPTRVQVCGFTLAFTMLTSVMASAQLGDLRKRITGAVNAQVGQEFEDLLRNGVRCGFRDEACIRQAKAEKRTPILTDDNGTVLTDKDGRPISDPVVAAADGAAAERPGTKRRAAAVKAFLVATYGVDAGRLETEGFGETRPVASNTSPEGRQQNRRVELVRQGR